MTAWNRTDRCGSCQALTHGGWIAASSSSGATGARRGRAARGRSPGACLVPRGGALLMRPLLLHASSAAEAPGHRRVIHLEYAVDPLPDGLAWYHDRPLHPSEGGTP